MASVLELRQGRPIHTLQDLWFRVHPLKKCNICRMRFGIVAMQGTGT